MIALLLLIMIFISITIGFKLGQLWYLDNYKQCKCSRAEISVEPPATMNGQTIYMKYINDFEQDFWQEKG